MTEGDRHPQLPNTIKIGPARYKMCLENSLHIKDGEFGEISFVEGCIKICSGMSVDKTAATVMHEIFHGIVNDCKTYMDDKTEESEVNLLSLHTLDALINSPGLLEYLISVRDYSG